MSLRKAILSASISARERKVEGDRQQLHRGNPSPVRGEILRGALVHENKYLAKERAELDELEGK